MNDDAMQGLLFGSAEEVVADDVASREMRVLTLNVQGSPATRRDEMLQWLYASECNVLVLTEMRNNDSGNRMIQELESSGFHVVRTRAEPDERYRTVIATKGFEVRGLDTPMATSRLAVARLTAPFGPVDVVGLYSVTNGMSEESSHSRRAFQESFLSAMEAHLRTHSGVPLVLTGDLNVLEPGHRPAVDYFEEHDYDFYRRLCGLGLVDAYRLKQPEGTDLSWYGPKGGQRLDHTFLTSGLVRHLSDCRFMHSVRECRISDHSAMTALLR
ncbi:endonuclease/exonuclease/phosphatase family protein [Streptomyces rubiginosohelvolus]|uniref:endonuclease/exonuclease/phosphatase family protein n=1 Tax=Streptomyces rubiginosohelvolus TaxID=67362 RepID=UPI0036542B83